MSTYLRCVFAVLAFAMFTGDACAQKTDKSSRAEAPEHAWLGVSLQDVTPRLAREEELPAKSGALVQDVVEDSPADKAGFAEGDIIVAFNGKEIEDSEGVITAVGGLSPGSKAEVTVMRKSGKATLAVTLAKQESRVRSYSFSVPDMPPVPRIRIMTHQDLLGMSLTGLSRQLGEYFEVPKGRGVLVEEVEEESPAAKAGIKAGDVIVTVDGATTKDPGDVAEALNDASTTARVPVDIIRKGKPVKAELDAAQFRKDHHRRHQFFWKDEDMSWSKPDREKFRMEMQKMKEGLRKMGTELSINMRELGRKIRFELEHSHAD
jgi:C-terminal processing protease CtpA/Prc